MEQRGKPFALKPGEGWIYDAGVDFIVKARESGPARFAVLEYSTDEDEWPGHTHKTEDEAFFVLAGSLIFRCGHQEFDVDEGGFVFLPCGVQHGYKIRDGGKARLLVITAPVAAGEEPKGWNGFIGEMEASMTPVAMPDIQ